MILPDQRESIDRDGCETAVPGKRFLQEGMNRQSPIRPDATRQAHVAAEFLEHIGLSPAVEVFGLTSIEPARGASVSFRLRHRQAEAIEGRDAVRRQPFEGR